MKIFEVILSLSQGGAEKFVVDLCNELSNNNEVTLIVLRPLIPPYDFFLEHLSDKVNRIYIPDNLLAYLRFLYLISVYKPDIVHTHIGRTLRFPLLSYIFNRAKTAFIHTVHNEAQHDSMGVDRVVSNLVFKLHLSCPVTISHPSNQTFIACYGFSGYLIPNGCSDYIPNIEACNAIKRELLLLKEKRISLNILNVARISYQKNQETLVDVINDLNQEGYSVDLFITGNEGDLTYDDINKKKSPFVHYLGLRTNVRDYMYVADAFCLSSLFEGMPISLIECLSVGTIPICTPVGGIIDIISQNKNGLLSEGTSKEEIKSAIKSFVSLSSKEKLRISEQTRNTFNYYSMTICAERYTLLMNKLKNF